VIDAEVGVALGEQCVPEQVRVGSVPETLPVEQVPPVAVGDDGSVSFVQGFSQLGGDTFFVRALDEVLLEGVVACTVESRTNTSSSERVPAAAVTGAALRPRSATGPPRG